MQEILKNINDAYLGGMKAAEERAKQDVVDGLKFKTKASLFVYNDPQDDVDECRAVVKWHLEIETHNDHGVTLIRPVVDVVDIEYDRVDENGVHLESVETILFQNDANTHVPNSHSQIVVDRVEYDVEKKVADVIFK